MQRIPEVFVSYAHADGTEWVKFIEEKLSLLVDAGMLRCWSDSAIEPGEDWNSEILEAMDHATCAVLLLTEGFFQSSYIARKELPRLHARWNDNGFPVIPISCSKHTISDELKWIESCQFLRKDQTLEGSDDRKKSQYAYDLVHRLANILADATPSDLSPLDSTKEDLSKFPMSPRAEDASFPILGREQELAVMDLAFSSSGAKLISLVASGGCGKTTTLREWLKRLGDGLKTFEYVFAWSFYSQGASPDKPISIDPFLNEALDFLEIPGKAKLSALDKASLIVAKLRDHRCLLILDGLEPLQHPPGTILGGKFREPAIEELLRSITSKRFCDASKSLCVVTTRQKLVELIHVKRDANSPLQPYIELELDNLIDPVGARLLHTLGVTRQGSRQLAPDAEELQDASSSVDGHALTLSLIGRYLGIAGLGDLRQIDRIGLLDKDKLYRASATDRMLERFERWFSNDQQLPLSILRLLGLFDRPASAELLYSLRSGTQIPGMTDGLFQQRDSNASPISTETWNTYLSFLSQFNLVTFDSEGTVDCHPLIREYFAKSVAETNPVGWSEGNRRLADTLLANSNGETLEGAQLKYRGATHLCHAGDYGRAASLYNRDISESFLGKTTRHFGTFSSELAFLSSFFDEAWKLKSLGNVSPDDRNLILSQASFSLMQVGRFEEAEPVALGILREPQSRNRIGAIVARNLGNSYLARGQPKRAIETLRDNLNLADTAEEEFMRFGFRTSLGFATLQANGPTKETSEFFSEAWKKFEDWKPKTPPELPSYHYAKFLIAKGDISAARDWITDVRNRVESKEFDERVPPVGLTAFGKAAFILVESLCFKEDKDWTPSDDWVQTTGDLVNQSGRRDLICEWSILRSEINRRSLDYGQAMDHVDKARRIALTDDRHALTCEALVQRASIHLSMNSVDTAMAELDEALAIASNESYGLVLQEVDCRLQRVEAMLRKYKGTKEASEEWEKVATLISESSYELRQERLAGLRQDILSL